MKYDISKTTAPKMPNLGRGLESVALLLSQVSKDMHQPIVPMLFPILGAHVSGAEFMYPDLSWKEPSGMLANLVAESGAGKGQLSSIVEAVCRDFRAHDDEELAKLVEWQKMMKTKSANKEKPARPDVAFWFPPADVTNAAFIQNAMGCEKLGQRTQYLNMPEVEMADRVCGGHPQHLRPPASRSTQSHSRRRDGQPRSACQHHHLLNAIRRTQVLQERTLQRHLRTRCLLLQATPRSRRTHTTPRQVRRRLLQEPRRIPRTSCHLQGSLHNQAAQPPYRPARYRHGFACRPCRRRHSVGHLKTCSRLGMESRMPALGAQQPDMDKAHEQPRGMARLPRHLVEDAGLRRHARSGRGQRQRGWQTWSEESARRSARLVQRSSA